MKRYLKVLTAILLVLGSLLALAGAAACWWARDGLRLKATLELLAGDYLDADVRIGKMAYQTRPLRIRLEEVQVGGAVRLPDVTAKVARVEAQLRLEGGWGRRRCVVERLEVEGPELNWSGEPWPAKVWPQSTPPSAWRVFWGRVVAYLTFGEVVLQQASLTAGTFQLASAAGILDLTAVTGTFQAGRGLEVSAAALVRWPSREGLLSVQQLVLHYRPGQPGQGQVKAGRSFWQMPGLVLESAGLETRFTLDEGAGVIRLPDLQLDWQGVWRPAEENPDVPLVGRLEMAGEAEIGSGAFRVAPCL